jgi:hypothetical protein
VQCVTLHTYGTPQHRLAVPKQAYTHMTAIRIVAECLDEPGLGELVDEEGDAGIGGVQLAGQRALDSPVRPTGGDHKEEVIPLLGEAESRQCLAHDRLGLGKSAAQLGNELDVGQRIACQPHPLCGHAVNVHGEAIECVESPAAT